MCGGRITGGGWQSMICFKMSIPNACLTVGTSRTALGKAHPPFHSPCTAMTLSEQPENKKASRTVWITFSGGIDMDCRLFFVKNFVNQGRFKICFAILILLSISGMASKSYSAIPHLLSSPHSGNAAKHRSWFMPSAAAKAKADMRQTTKMIWCLWGVRQTIFYCRQLIAV